MFKRTLSLTKVLIKTNIIASFSKQGLGKKKFWNVLMLLFAYGYLGIVAGIFSLSIIDNLMVVNQHSAFITVVCFVNVISTLFETIITSANILYFSKDNEYLLPLPFRPLEIVASKINTLLAFSYFSEIFFGLIPLVIYGILTKASILFYIFVLVVLLILPVVPMLLAALIMMVVMSFVNLSKHKGLFQTLSILFVIVISMGISRFSANSAVDQQEIIALLSQADGLAKSMYPYFPTLKFAGEALINTSFISLLLLVVISVVAYVVVILISNKLYFKGVVGNSTTGSYSKKKVDKKDFIKANVALSYLAKEIKCLFRKPVYFTQCVLPSLILPIIMLLPFIQGFGGFKAMAEMGSKVDDLHNGNQIVFLVFLLVCIFMSMYTYISITAVSRDGAAATFMKYIPIPFYQQLIYKCLPDMLLSFVPNSIIFVSLALIMKLPILPIVLALIIYGLFVVGRSFFGIIIDCKKPKHNFTSEYQVVKSNFSIFYDIVYSFVLLVPVVLSLIYSAELSLIALFIINLVFYGLIAVGIYKYIEKQDFKLAKKIY